MEEKMKKETKKVNKPVYRTRIGAVSGSIFINETKDGGKFPSAVISRSYKTDKGFKESSSYGARHLNELAALVADLQAWFQGNYPEAAQQA
jgi:hypothetical protein